MHRRRLGDEERAEGRRDADEGDRLEAVGDALEEVEEHLRATVKRTRATDAGRTDAKRDDDAHGGHGADEQREEPDVRADEERDEEREVVEGPAARDDRERLRRARAVRLGTRLTSLDLTFTVISEGDAILKAAQGFSALRQLFIPSEFEGDAKFFSNLCRARPELTALEFGGFEVTDACVKIACNNLRLRYLDIQSSSLTRALVDIILTSPSSETLEEVLFHNVPFGALDAAGLARLVAGCPVLSSVHYQEPCDHTDDATPDLAGVFDAIARRLESRGGALDLNAFS